MSRYIDADKLIFSRVRIIHPDGTAGGWNAVVMSSVINNAPTADVVEVVRCKDCKYYDDGECGYHSESKEMRTYERWTVDVNEDDYCSYGKRRRKR